MSARRYELDEGAGGGRRLGLIVLSTDETLEFEARQVMGRAGVNLLHARIPAHAEVTPETLRLMEAELPRVAATLPGGLGAIGYGCTSGATVIGPGVVQELVQGAHPGVPVTNPLSAVVTALEALGVRRIGLVTPYVAEVNAPLRAALAERGIEVLSEVSFGEKDDWTVARITEASTSAAMLEAGSADGVEAVFASCTNLRTFGVIDAVEAGLGVPVVTSNLALCWHVLQLGGVETAGAGPGRLFARLAG